MKEAVLFSGKNESRSISEDAFLIFRECCPVPPTLGAGGLEGKRPDTWYAAGPTERPEADLTVFGLGWNRSLLTKFQANRDVPTLALCIAVLAWGGMHNANRNRLFSQDTAHWIAVAQRIRDGNCSRSEAFAAFAELSLRGKLAGMGPAYYTKLIYALMPRSSGQPVGYIMDQWLGCSINLLFGQDMVLMDETATWSAGLGGGPLLRQTTSTVSKLNTAPIYERFCRALELLADRLGPGWTPDSTELALLSRGGRHPGKWRKHVMESRGLTSR